MASSKPSRGEETFASRLKAQMDEWHINQASIAARLEISPGTVSGWFTKGALPQPRILSALSAMLGVTPEWLAHGRGPKLNEPSQRVGEQIVSTLPISVREKAKTGDDYGVRILSREVPLISWAQAGQATAFDEIPEHWQETIPAAVNDRKAFAIQIRGDSMEPKYSDGDAVVLLPQSPARNGDLVVANIKEEGFAFKILTLVGGDPRRIKLTSYNPAYPPMEFDREHFHWIYPVHSVNKVIRR